MFAGVGAVGLLPPHAITDPMAVAIASRFILSSKPIILPPSRSLLIAYLTLLNTIQPVSVLPSRWLKVTSFFIVPSVWIERFSIRVRPGTRSS